MTETRVIWVRFMYIVCDTDHAISFLAVSLLTNKKDKWTNFPFEKS